MAFKLLAWQPETVQKETECPDLSSLTDEAFDLITSYNPQTYFDLKNLADRRILEKKLMRVDIDSILDLITRVGVDV